MTRNINYAIKQSLNCMKGAGIDKFTTNDVVDKCFELFYNDSEWKPNSESIKTELVKFKKNESYENFRKGKITACGKIGRLDLLTWT